MSAWDDSWGYGSRKALDVGVSASMGSTKEDAAPRCVNTVSGAANHLIGRWLEMTPAYVCACGDGRPPVETESLQSGVSAP